jgi:hypothetical protein
MHVPRTAQRAKPCHGCYRCILTKVSRIVNVYAPATRAVLGDGLRWLCPICFYDWLCHLDERAQNESL